MSISLSVIICAHNPREEYLTRTLEGLRSQTLPLDQWEFVLVDNASTEPLAKRFSLSWHPNGRTVVESKLGLTPARFRGIAETSGELIVFVDDDNVLQPNYLEKAVEIAAAWPQLGVWGGRVIPEFEVPPPAWSTPYLYMLTLRNFTSDKWSNLALNYETSPCGAGMTVRRSVAEEYVRRAASDPLRVGLGRRGASLVSCEDSDMAFTACDMGLGQGQFVALEIKHLIPERRMEEEYLLRLAEGLAYSMRLLTLIRRVRPLPDSPLVKFNRFVRRTRMSRRERRFNDAEVRGTRNAQRFFDDFAKSQGPSANPAERQS